MQIAFDFDGTLLDSRNRHVVVLRAVWPEVDDLLGDSWTERFWARKLHGASTRYFLLDEGVSSADLISKKWIQRIEEDSMLLGDKPYAFSHDVLSALSKENELYLATARCNERGAREQFTRTNFATYFRALYVVPAGSGASDRKADVTSKHGLDVIIGDTESDAEWAAKCGAAFIPVSWGFRSTQFWQSAGYDPVNDYLEMLSVINSIN